MDSLLWNLRTNGSFTLGAPFIQALVMLLVLSWDYLLLVPLQWFRVARHGLRPPASAPAGPLPSMLVVIPTLLRKREELTSLMSTVQSVAENGYPSNLHVIVSIDGFDEAPDLYRELRAWARELRAWAAVQRPRLRLFLAVTGTPQRRGKPMAIEQGIGFLEGLVSEGRVDRFPEIYVSTDADADLGAGALELLARRLVTRHPITGWPARAVAGNLHLRANQLKAGFARSLTTEGQLTLQIAREYMVANISRYNLRIIPMCGVPGVLYCTWSDILRQAPRFMAYMRTLTLVDWARWWIGIEPPKFSETRVAPIPELLAGDTDDTVTAFMASIARYRDGRFTFDAPRTPFHALSYMLRALFVDRALRYEPAAKVYTSSPTTIKSLFKQRRRWNSSRIEVTGRFWAALPYHWSLGLPASTIVLLMVKYWAFGAVMYLLLPFAIFKAKLLTGFVIGYSCHLMIYSVATALSLLVDGNLGKWRLLAALPLSPLYALLFSYLPAVVGGVSDVFLFGNVTGFAPEATLIRGGSSRIALLFRLRRALSLAFRAAVRGDVVFGAFWFGWRETRLTPSGYRGWTTKKKPAPIIPPVSKWFSR